MTGPPWLQGSFHALLARFPPKGRQRFLLLAAACVALTVVAGFYFIRSLLTPDTGLIAWYPEITVDQGRVTFSPSEPFSAAAASGLLAD